ncbi:MAG TPA: helix-turn-helix domain-containing protein [Ktedonosporobacter sp.]|nr:helix-turn-helix domain-containing protein [Ktedonosporobacter sp.]
MHFGERLRQERLRRHLSQEALAEALGVSAKSISRWEQEQAVPQASVRLHLSRFFGLPPQDLFGDAESLPPPTRLWGVPFPRDPYFTGREDLLHQIHTALWADPPTVHTSSCALYGLGGMGKTHLALEYAYRHALSYEAVFWISAQSVESILSSFLTIAELLHLPERQEADQQRIIAAVQRWLSTQSRWLLIWDNLEEIDWLPRFQPPAPWGAVLITTQRQALGTLTQGLELLTMTEEEGMLLLLRRAKVLSPQATSEQMQQFAMSQPSEYAAARQVVRVLAGLPLALDQAGAYLEETGCGLSDYLRRYEGQRTQLLRRRGTPAGGHPHSVASTFGLSCERVEREYPAAVELLRISAFLFAEAIPEEVFVTGGFGYEAGQFDLAIAALRTFSLVQRHPQTRTLSMHRLVQAVIREEMSEQERARWQ